MENEVVTYWYYRSIAYLIIIPFLIGVFRYKKIDSSFRPFYFVIFFDFFTEVLYEILTRTVHTNAISYNFYNLVVFFLIGTQLIRWGALTAKSWWTIFVGCFVLVFWTWDNLIVNTLWTFNSKNIILISSIICLFLIRTISNVHLIIKKERQREIIYAIVSIWVVKYLFLIISETSWLFFGNLGTSFSWNLGNLAIYSGALFNIAYAVIALWIPKKRKYSWL